MAQFFTFTPKRKEDGAIEQRRNFSTNVGSNTRSPE